MTEQPARAIEELVLKTVIPIYVQMWLLPWHELENSLVHKCFTLKFIDEADHCYPFQGHRKWTGAHVSFGGLTRMLREELSGVLLALLPIAQKIILHCLRNERVLLFSETPERKHKQPLHS